MTHGEKMHIKTSALFLTLVVILFSAACKRTQPTPVPTPSPTPPKRIAGPPPPVIGKPYPGKGVVILINRKEGWIEIDHEEIVDLMPPMQMEWFVEKPSLLNNVKEGDKVLFTVVETGKGELITEIKKIKN
jgi:Cu/Ag efflux protein CusF